MNEYLEHIDTSYDKTFEGIRDLPWWPWVGKSYREAEAKTFVLGESAYNYNPGSEKVSRELEEKDFLRTIHERHAMDYKKKTRYVRNIERALFQTKSPSVKSVESFWTSVIYHNLVLEPMSTKTKRPVYQQYVDGWEMFIELAEMLQPAQCIVYGLETIKLKSLNEVCARRETSLQLEKLRNKVSRSYPRRVILPLSYGTLKMLFIRHPSQYFSWKNWGNILREEIQLQGVEA